MANKRSAKKAIRTIAARTEANGQRRSRIRTYIKKVEEAIASGDRNAAEKALRDAQPEIMRGGSKGVTHPNTASRKISRLAKRIHNISN